MAGDYSANPMTVTNDDEDRHIDVNAARPCQQGSRHRQRGS